MINIDQQTIYLIGGIFGLLIFASILTQVLAHQLKAEKHQGFLTNLKRRTNAWWVMSIIFVLAILTGGIGSLVLFTLISFVALREYITLTPTTRADHRALFWLFFIILPLQYLLIYLQWYGLFSIMIPVYAFIFIPLRTIIADNYTNFLERTAKIQWGLMVCVYFVSHIAALLMLKIPGYELQNAKLLFFFVVVVQLSDVFQYAWGNICGKRKIAPNISPNKTLEGAVLGILTATLLGTALAALTPFSFLAAFLLSLTICVMGIVGDLTLSAIKRDAQVKDYGELIQGHGGMLDRIDSLCFAAPVFFHLVRYFYT